MFLLRSHRPCSVKVSMVQRLLPYLPNIGSLGLRRALMGVAPHDGVRKIKKLVDVMTRRSTEIYELKKRALEQGDESVTHQVGEGKDIMSILRASRCLFSFLIDNT